MIAENILVQLGEFGHALKVEGDECAIVQVVPGAKLPPKWIAEFMREKVKNKQRLLALCVCRECGRVTTDLEDMGVLKTNYAICDRGACPYRPKERR